MSQFYSDAIFWVEVDKIRPNPYQPRRDFNEAELQSLADSIRQYGVLQALVVTRQEREKEGGEGLAVDYELIAGERRLRAARLAGLKQVPVLIRTGDESGLMKLELAIIENIQREDLNPVDRAKAFQQLASDFGFKHVEIGKKVGKSREYVSNTLRILSLPEFVLRALSEGKITEGHTRPLMMLTDRPQEQETLFKEIIFKKLNVRDAERIARHIAVERARKLIDPELIDIEDKFKETLGTRVRIEKKSTRAGAEGGDEGGKVTIDYFSKEDLLALLEKLNSVAHVQPEGYVDTEKAIREMDVSAVAEQAEPLTEEDKLSIEDSPSEDEDLYSVSNFSI